MRAHAAQTMQAERLKPGAMLTLAARRAAHNEIKRE
jgi:hypothetical protein